MKAWMKRGAGLSGSTWESTTSTRSSRCERSILKDVPWQESIVYGRLHELPAGVGSGF
ncbi:hypothetical protein P3T31_003107 [Rhizobium sp. AN70]|nr:hypothetical protein [Rhizobium sp. AN70]